MTTNLSHSPNRGEVGRENGLAFGIFSLYNGAGYLPIKCSEYSHNNSQSLPQYRGRLPVHAQELLHSDLNAIGTLGELGVGGVVQSETHG